ncbi:MULTISPECIES: carbohydrate ABC transporter permease [Bacillales]|uniref:ABC transporter permease n=1 Tax=Guptibacillus hwajinpoensis TaxID=208199 RepID=A0A0J6CYY7_9BACL|nr:MULTISPECIES: carbohydrate ABC transporter permease [Bacillaceae]KMM38313.1 ABC transporter permease [Alkalihalobacillus macyae]MBF0708794.1 carbohydrate ABC transporter permease [Pseudalkalibacillus hwajinpoensis]MDO6656835.1 carbohydrate ABC transporter permease [Anaerobacillus sp. 1_MG-2023]WLR60061.1 carbohydrate ABC transporter permease [Pseudalkalibacillus hwajinpoensis]
MVKNKGDRAFDLLVTISLILVGVLSVFPLLFVVAVSLTPIEEVLKNGGFVLIPEAINFDAYTHLLSQPKIPKSFMVTIFITVVGTIINLILTTLMAYPLSRKNLPGRNIFIFLVVFTLLFNGGIVPTYLIVKATGLLNSVWAMIIPNAIWSFNVLIMKSFFENLPEDIFEAARIDGAGEFRILGQIVLALSKPVMITIGLFYVVGHWNEFFQAVMYITDPALNPLQVVVRDILVQNQDQIENVDAVIPTATIQMAAVIIASLPIIVIYPFVQKHLTKGMLLGSIKG